MAINAVQICVLTALALVPKNDFTFRFTGNPYDGHTLNARLEQVNPFSTVQLPDRGSKPCCAADAATATSTNCC
jgi:hypothetical protein